MNQASHLRQLNNLEIKPGPIVCWLSRDQRVKDNWVLLEAQSLAKKMQQPLVVIFCLSNTFLGATKNHYHFMLLGLQELEASLAKLNIKLLILSGEPDLEVTKFCQQFKAGALYSDHSPLKLPRLWKNKVAAKINCAFFEVDAHNIIPVWVTSNKQEFGAYTIRPKINKLLPDFLTEFPKLKKQTLNFKIAKNNWTKLLSNFEQELPYSFRSGEAAANLAMRDFIKNRLNSYHLNRNDPNLKGQSELSPYLHFGQLSAGRLALEVKKAKAPLAAKEAFLEELIVRRELADNFCFYNPNYDNKKCLPKWAEKSFAKHELDKREYLYTKKDLEISNTHDNLWNAAQKELVKTGKMPGYLRMYWAKKILEWTPNLNTAFKIAIYLNDTYALDGRDPNGYTGIAWSLGGVHDRAWFERPIFGQIRYMNYNGCRHKFNVDLYIKSRDK